jgi:hypothetical protein
MVWPTVQNGGTATNSVCMRRPAVSFGIIQRAAKPHPLGKRQGRQNFALIGLVEVFENVDGVVGIKISQRFGDPGVGQCPDDFEPYRFINLRKGGKIELVAQQRHQCLPLRGGDGLEKIAEFRFMQWNNLPAQEQHISIGNRCADCGQIFLADGPILAINFVLIVGIGVWACLAVSVSRSAGSVMALARGLRMMHWPGVPD